MKIVEYKCGTKKEIIAYLEEKEKVKCIFNRIAESYPTELSGMKKGDIFQWEFNTIYNQIDEFIKSGSPLVSVTLPIFGQAEYYKEQFVVEDFAELRIQFEMENIDKKVKNLL